MATSAASRYICEEVYHWEEKLLLLHCSHTFCCSCVQQMQSIINNMCPVCRSSWEGQYLTVIFHLFGNWLRWEKPPIKMNWAHENICAVQNADQFLRCNHCTVPICNRCLGGEHTHCTVPICNRCLGGEHASLWISIDYKNTEVIKSSRTCYLYTKKNYWQIHTSFSWK